MKRIIRFSKFFVPAAIISVIMIVAGIIGYFALGFNLGVDFQAGLNQEIQFAPTALTVTYNGAGNAKIEMGRSGITVVISGVTVEGVTHEFRYAEYTTLGALVSAINSRDGLNGSVASGAPADTPSILLVQSAQGNPQLGSDPYVIHYSSAGAEAVSIDEVRATLLPLGSVSVQVLGEPSERRFMIRMQDEELSTSGGAQIIIDTLGAAFGRGNVAVTKSEYVGSRFSENLANQAGILMALTLLVILVYATIRFKPQYAVGAVLAIGHDALIMVAFIVWTRMEFNTTTIAAILTILGYSINDTIVIFDRIRETRRLYVEDNFTDILNRAITETLGRTVITTVTTMLAVLSLYIFTTQALFNPAGFSAASLLAIFTEHSSMKDFALALLVGMVSGVYSTIFIASAFVNFWEIQSKKNEKKKLLGSTKVTRTTVPAAKA